jgi:hypothetical protein
MRQLRWQQQQEQQLLLLLVRLVPASVRDLTHLSMLTAAAAAALGAL